jgi:hypothetical protein
MHNSPQSCLQTAELSSHLSYSTHHVVTVQSSNVFEKLSPHSYTTQQIQYKNSCYRFEAETHINNTEAVGAYLK